MTDHVVRWLFDIVAPVVYVGIGAVSVPLIILVFVSAFQEVTNDV